MSERIAPPFRADHVGSLLRPLEVKKAHADLQMGRITALELRSIEDEAVRKAVLLQETLGFQLATYGEIRRNHWHSDFIYQIGGIRKRQERREVTFHTASGEVIFSQEEIDVGARSPLKERSSAKISGSCDHQLRGRCRKSPSPRSTSPCENPNKVDDGKKE